MKNHTPGQWVVAERQIWNASVRFVRTDHDNSGVVGLTNDGDAHLVAAAKDLLKAVEAVLEEYEEGRGHTVFEIREMCRKAKHKAYGEKC